MLVEIKLTASFLSDIREMFQGQATENVREIVAYPQM